MLESEVALVTGASRGIGAAIALSLAGAGAKVIGTATSAEGAAKISAALKEKGHAGHGEVLDAGSPASIDALMAGLDQGGQSPTILINNAAITRDTLLLRMKPEDWDAVIATNLTAVFRLCKASVRRMMKERRGRIVNLTSVVGLTGNAGQVNYAAAKAGLLGFTKSLAKELASRNITVNAVAPGFIDTDMTRALNEGQRTALLESDPARAPGHARGRGRRGPVSRLPAVELHHRGNAAREWRHVHALGCEALHPAAAVPRPGSPVAAKRRRAARAAALARRSNRPSGAGSLGSAPGRPSNF